MTSNSDEPITFVAPTVSSGVGIVVAVVQGKNHLYYKQRWVNGTPDQPVSPTSVSAPSGTDLTFTAYGTTWDIAASQGGDVHPFSANFRGTLQTSLLHGGFHRWNMAEWTGGPTFDASQIQAGPNISVGTIVEGSVTAPAASSAFWQDVSPYFPDPNASPQRPFPYWKGGGADLYITQGRMKPSRNGIAGALGTSGPDGLRKSTSTTKQAAADCFGSNSIGRTNATGQVEFMDVNGDQYPDSLAGGQIQLNNGVDGFRVVPNDMSFAAIDGNSYGDPRVEHTTQFSSGVGTGAPIAQLSAKGESVGTVSLSIFQGVTYGYSTTSADMVDVNGDGLPDHVLIVPGHGMSVRLNLGNRFSAEIPWTAPDWSVTSLGPMLKGGGGLSLLFPQTQSDDITNFLAGVVNDSDTRAVKLADNAANNLSGGVSIVGVGTGFSVNRTYIDFVDLNGDGLPDRVMKVPGEAFIRYQLNMGESFAPEATFAVNDWGLALEDISASGLGADDALSFTETSSISGNVGPPGQLQTAWGCFVGEATVAGGTSHTQSELRLQDIDGDGRPDEVLKLNSDNSVRAQINGSGQANLLEEVVLPGGGTFTIGYKRQGNTVNLTPAMDPVTGRTQVVDMPTNQYAMASVFVQDSVATPPLGHELLSTFDYFNSGRYDRIERESFGYQRVLTTHNDGSRTDAYFRNQAYDLRHLPDVVFETDAKGNLSSKTTYAYDERPIAGAPIDADGVAQAQFPAEVSKTTSYYELQTSNPAGTQIVTEETKDYDTLGNLTSFVDMGDTATGTDDVFYKIGYDPAWPLHLIFRANLVEARDAANGGGNLLRQRTATYDSRGAFQTITNRLVGGRDPSAPTTVHDGTQNPSMALSYDAFGNLGSFTDPDGYSVTYTYDPLTESFRTGSTDVFGLTSTATPKYEWGTLASVTDVNGQTEQFGFDNFGRPSFVVGPKDGFNSGTGVPIGTPTIQFTYNLATQFASAKTQHKDTSGAAGVNSTATIDTYTYVDGLERVVQTKKTNEVVNAAGQAVQGFTVSGALTFDNMGRVAQRGQPVFVATTTAEAENVAMLNQTTYTYDVLSRVLTVTTPDTSVTTTAYTIATTPSLAGRNLFEKTVTDQKGNLRTEWRDGRQRILFVDEHNVIPPATTPEETDDAIPI